MEATALAYAAIPSEAERFREEVRAFLAREMPAIDPLVRAESWMGFDAGFSRRLGAAGLIGLTMPPALGGRGAGPFARYVVSEELLAAGAPVSAHWIADRQSAPLLLHFGTAAQQHRYIPSICRGETFVGIGMSEPNSGSDLASIATLTTQTDTGWRLDGHKIWTTNAHRSHHIIVLARTSQSDDRHGGMSQFIVDLSLPGVTVRPIRDMTGEEHFNEIFFDAVALTDDALIGAEGAGWRQVMAELAFERSGPERFLSAMALLPPMIAHASRAPDSFASYQIGRIAARLSALRQMSLAVTAELAEGRKPAWAASCVKDLGTTLEQQIPDIAQLLLDEPRIAGGDEAAQLLARVMQLAPSFSLRGGTREILRGILAAGLGVR